MRAMVSRGSWQKRDYDKLRIRGRTLQSRRAKWFRQHPLCVDCQSKGLLRQATELDHIKPLSAGGADDETNIQGLCTDCHAAKSILERGAKPRPRIGVDGWPVKA